MIFNKRIKLLKLLAVVTFMAVALVSCGDTDDPSSPGPGPSSDGILQYFKTIKDGAGGMMEGMDGTLLPVMDSLGNHVYVTGRHDNSIVIFNRDTATGALTYSKAIENGVDGVSGLSSVSKIAISPDDKNIYATSSSEDSISVFNRDASTGDLTYSETLKNGENGVDGLDGAYSIVVSPDNKNVYVASLYDDALVVFTRNTTTGKLTYFRNYKNGEGGVSGLKRPTSIAVDSTGFNIYVTSYTEATLVIFRRDRDNGALSYQDTVEEKKNGVSGMVGPSAIIMSPDNKYVYVSGEISHRVVVFKRNTSVSLDYSGNFETGTYPPRSIAISPDNKNLYVGSGSRSSITVFNRNTSTGGLNTRRTITDELFNVPKHYMVIFLAVSPDSKNIYAANYETDTLLVFNRDTGTGDLTHSSSIEGGVGGANMMLPESVAVSPDNKSLYVASYGDSSITVFKRDTSTGDLTYSTNFKDGVDGVDGLNRVRSVTVSPDNKNVYAVGNEDDAIVVFSRSTDTGDLTYSTNFKDGVNGVEGLDGARSVAVSPDGRFVSVVSEIDNAMAIFSRNTATGDLTYVAWFLDNQNGMDGLWGAASVTMSPDNKSIYIAGHWDNAIGVFSYNSTNAELGYSTNFKNEVNGVEGLTSVMSVAVSPDNQNVYAVGNEGTIAVFNRNADTGDMTYSTNFKNTVNGIEGLHGASSVTVDPSGEYVYVAGHLDDALVVFDRDTATGSLTYSQTFKDVGGLKGPTSVTVSPDGRNIYIVSRNHNSIAIFKRY